MLSYYDYYWDLSKCLSQFSIYNICGFSNFIRHHLYRLLRNYDHSQFYYPISINYSGSWSLAYWVEGQNSVKGTLSGSGNYQTTITFYVVGYAEDTLCANATKLSGDSLQQNDLNLTLSVLGATNSTTASSTEVCATMAV